MVLAFNGHNIRVVMIDGLPWWVLADVCRVLEVGNSRMVAARLDEDEKDDVNIADAIGRDQPTTVVNESGLYSVIFTSNKGSCLGTEKIAR
jgi:prophage antirepressor-like protein